jgi:hypothetical protein
MVYQVRLLKGILEPYRSRYQLQNAEAVTKLGLKLLFLYFLSLIVFAIGGYFGIGSESFSKEITTMSANEFEAAKLLILSGNIITGILAPSIYIFLAALFFWIVTDIPYIKLVIVQMILFGAISRKNITDSSIRFNGYRQRCQSFFIGDHQSVFSQE